VEISACVRNRSTRLLIPTTYFFVSHGQEKDRWGKKRRQRPAQSVKMPGLMVLTHTGRYQEHAQQVDQQNTG
jgi:hypothetical protein